MFFDNELISFNVLEVLELNQKNINIYNNKRNFHALSFRTRSETTLETDSEKHHISDNYITFVPAQQSYKRISTIDEMIVIHFDAANCNSNGIEYFYPENPNVFKELFENILNCWKDKKTGYKYKCAEIFNKILYLSYLQNFKSDRSGLKIQKSIDYMMAHFNDTHLSIGKIAAQSYVSEVYFRKLFKAEYGLSPQKYIVRLRMQYAAQLINTGYFSLGEVAAMTGYNDYKYFSSEFKKQTGFSPSSYFYNYENK